MPTNLTLLRYVFFGIIVNNTNSLVQGRQRYTVTGVVRFLPERLGARVAPGSWSHPADDSLTQRATPASGALTLYVCLARYGIGECVERCEKSKRIIAIKVATVISAVVRGAVKQQCQVADRWCQQRNLRIRERGQSIQLGGFEQTAMGNRCRGQRIPGCLGAARSIPQMRAEVVSAFQRDTNSHSLDPEIGVP